MGNTSGKSASRNRTPKKSVHWKAADKPSPPGAPQLIASPSNLDPDVVTLRWDRPNTDGGSPIIGYLVEHKRTGSPHWVKATPGLVGKPELSISGLEPGWRYQFRVYAHNAVDSSDPSDLSEPLTVTLQRNIITAPRFTLELPDTITALENDKIEFMVHISGIPTPTVAWYKDGFEIFSSRRTRIITDNGQSILVIHQTALVDEGEIKCTATNKAGHVTCKTNLYVEAPPRIRLPRQYEDGLLFEMDETIRLKVSVAGKPAPEVFWSHNGESIANDPRYEITNADKSSALRVSHAKRIDRGEYQIRAVNKLGDHIANFLVTVTDKPTPPQNVKVMSLGKTVTISWSAPEDDGGCKIGTYIIEYNRVGWNVWLKAGTSRKLSSTLGELIEGSEYRFRIKAENPYGISEPSVESDIVFIPDPKRGILEPRSLRSSQSRSRDVLDNFENIKSPVIQKTAASSLASSQASLDSRPTSPLFRNEPIRPVRGNKPLKTPSMTPDPSPITHRRDYNNPAITNNIFDRSSAVRELSYGTTNIQTKFKTDNTQLNKFISSIERRSVSPSPEPRSYGRAFSPSMSSREVSPQPVPRSFSISPPPISRKPTSRPLSPNRTEETKPTNNNILFKEQNPVEHLTSPRNDDILHGSSEFMLVLYPNDSENSTKHQKSGSTSNLFDFSEAVAPPMSLSAPELGFEPPFLGSLRNAVSSSELLHERAMMRFYEATQQEETEENTQINKLVPKAIEFDTESNTSRRSLGPTSEIPTIRIETDESELLERKHSLRRRLSGSGISQQMLWQRRLSWNKEHQQKAAEEMSNVKEEAIVEKKDEVVVTDEEKKDSLKINTDALRDKLKLGMVRQRSRSEELEEEVFEQVRAKMSKQNSQEDKKEIKILPVEKWEEESIKEPSLAPTEEFSEEVDEEVEEEEELSDDDRPWLDEEIIPDRVEVPEEEIYHPRIMIPRPEPPKQDPPFEILNKPSPLPDPKFIPKPILKKKELPVVESLMKPALTTILSPVATIPEEPTSQIPEKPIRKVFPKKESKFLKNISALNPLKTKKTKLPEESKWSEQIVVEQPVPKPQPVIIISAAEAAKQKKLESRQNSIEETKVVVDHYTDIVREYGQQKKQPIPLLLDREALKRAAESQSDEDGPIMRKSPEPKMKHKVRRSPSPKEKPIHIQGVDDKKLIRALQKIESGTYKKIDSVESQQRPLRFDTKQESNEKPSPTSKTPSGSTDVLKTTITLEEAEIRARSVLDYFTDVVMLIVACYVYLFYDARLAIPLLLLMVYRQLREEIINYCPLWLRNRLKIKNQK